MFRPGTNSTADSNKLGRISYFADFLRCDCFPELIVQNIGRIFRPITCRFWGSTGTYCEFFNAISTGGNQSVNRYIHAKYVLSPDLDSRRRDTNISIQINQSITERKYTRGRVLSLPPFRRCTHIRSSV